MRKCFRRKTGAFANLKIDTPEKEKKGYRLRETDLRLNRTKVLNSTSQSKDSIDQNVKITNPTGNNSRRRNRVISQEAQVQPPEKIPKLSIKIGGAMNSSDAGPASNLDDVDPPKTYRDLRLRGFTGTRYDAEMLLSQESHDLSRNFPSNSSSRSSSSEKSHSSLTSSDSSKELLYPELPKTMNNSENLHKKEPLQRRKISKQGKDGDVQSNDASNDLLTISSRNVESISRRRRKAAKLLTKREDSNLTVTVRSLRNTPGRLQARCERGRIASDSSSTSTNSSGCFPSLRPSISEGSDDTNSNSSGSDQCDSGIETSSSASSSSLDFKSQNSFFISNSVRSNNVSDQINESRTNTLVKGVEHMNINISTDKPCSVPLNTTPTPEKRIKLTLRVKRSPILDEVLENGRRQDEMKSSSFGNGEFENAQGSRSRKRHKSPKKSTSVYEIVHDNEQHSSTTELNSSSSVNPSWLNNVENMRFKRSINFSVQNENENEKLDLLSNKIVDSEKLVNCTIKSDLEENLLLTKTQCKLTNSLDEKASENSIADIHCHESNIIPIPSARKRPLVETSGEKNTIESLAHPDSSINCNEATRPDDVKTDENMEANYVSTKTRTKRVKLKMGGTSFRTVDKIWATP